MTEENMAPSNVIWNIKRHPEYRANPINRHHDTYQTSINRMFAVFVVFLTLFFSVTELGIHQTATIVSAFMIGVGITVVFKVLLLYLIDWLKGN
jgi:hypothetical protein